MDALSKQIWKIVSCHRNSLNSLGPSCEMPLEVQLGLDLGEVLDKDLNRDLVDAMVLLVFHSRWFVLPHLLTQIGKFFCKNPQVGLEEILKNNGSSPFRVGHFEGFYGSGMKDVITLSFKYSGSLIPYALR